MTWFERLDSSEVYENFRFSSAGECTISTNDGRLFVIGGGDTESDNIGKVCDEIILSGDTEAADDEQGRVCFELESRSLLN